MHRVVCRIFGRRRQVINFPIVYLYICCGLGDLLRPSAFGSIWRVEVFADGEGTELIPEFFRQFSVERQPTVLDRGFQSFDSMILVFGTRDKLKRLADLFGFGYGIVVPFEIFSYIAGSVYQILAADVKLGAIDSAAQE